MRPFYFGQQEQPLFGIYTPLRDGTARRGAVLFCYPFGPEYTRSHRALREMSQHLSQLGYDTLRFDYFGCGDSGGTSEDGTVEQWLEDIACGIDELRETSGLERVSLLGLRFGATLAALAAARCPQLDRLVLWDPVLRGADYLLELDRRNQAFMLGRPRPRGWAPSEPPDEVLGTLLPRRLRDGIQGVDLLALPRLATRRVLLLTTEDVSGLDELRERLRSVGVPSDHEHVPSPPLWLRQDEVDRTLVPQRVIQCIAAWLEGSRT